jgi:hypothetical protein
MYIFLNLHPFKEQSHEKVCVLMIWDVRVVLVKF